MEKGNALFAQGQFAEASLNYRNALQKEPNSGEAYYRLALSEEKQNNGSAAYRALLQAVRLAPELEAAKIELANMALASYLMDPQRPKVLYDLLVKMSREWLSKDPNSLDGLRIKGYLAVEDRRPDEAVALFRRAHQLNPKQEKITLGLIDALYRNNQAAEAEKVGLEFVATEKTVGSVYDALYRLYQATGRVAEGENILVLKVKENPKETSYILGLASHYARNGKKTEMNAALQSFLANPASGPKAHLEAGDFFAAVGDWAAALDQYNAGIAANPKDSATYHNRIGRALISQGKRDEGLKVLNTAIAQNPDDGESRALRAALLLGTASGKPGEGLQEFQSLVDKNPDDTFLKFVFSKAQLESGNLAGARAQLLDVTKKLPHFLEAHITLAEIASIQGNLTEALQQAAAALEVDPRNLRAQLVSGTAMLRLGNLDEASAVLGRLSRQDPKSIDVRLALAILDLKKRKFPEAEAAFKRILDTDPNEWRALSGLVDLDAAQNRPEKGFARLEQELKRSHGAPQIRYMMVNRALKSGKYNVAIEQLRLLAAENPNSIDPQLQLADVLRLKGDYRNAITTLQKAALTQPKDARPAVLLPFLLQMENRKQEAKLQCRRALSLRPDDVASMNNLAFLLADTGDNLDEALKLAQDAVNKSPNQPYFADTLGFVYLKRDQNDDALEIFNNLVRKYPNEPTFSYRLGMAWYQKGDKARAKTELARALQRNPSKEVETGIHDLLSRMN